MGNTWSHRKGIKGTPPNYGGPWVLLYCGSATKWPKISGLYGFCEQPYTCHGEECDRESICLQYMKAQLHKCQFTIELQRFKKSSIMIPFGNIPDLKTKSRCGFTLCANICTSRKNLALLLLYRWDNLSYKATFICVNLAKKSVIGLLDAEPQNMSVIQCEFSPDNSIVAVVFYHRSDSTNLFQYDLFLYSLETFSCIDVLCLNDEVRPYIAFDPRYASSRIAVINYGKKGSPQLEKSLVTYCLNKHAIVCSSKVSLPFIFGNSCFSLLYTLDGRYLIVQKISDNRHGISSDTDTYIFDSDTLQLLWHHFTHLPSFGSFCSVNYMPLFSKCSSRICILDEKHTGRKPFQNVAIFQLPRPFNLQQLCRIHILECISSLNKVDKLPLPHKIKDFLKFSPMYYY
ncbi:uncharacterized protein LOC141906466 [Tubulanus polymorphus]|uniref:uncharacterized protein LOC141906466 n=1 Tax=Tubulanus polymorphus TaxID=672921 RepID=UPI003DA60F8C